MNCPKCNATITNEEAAFCPTCGEKLISKAETAQVTPQTESNISTEEAATSASSSEATVTNTVLNTAPVLKKGNRKILIAAIAVCLVIAVVAVAVWNPFASKSWTYDSFCEASKEWVTHWELDTDRSTASTELYSFTPSNAETAANLFSLTFACENNKVTYATVSFFLDDNGEYKFDAQFFPLCMLDDKIASMWKDATHFV